MEEPSRTGTGRLARRRRAALAGHADDDASARALRHDDDPSVRAIALGALARAGVIDAEELRAGSVDPAADVRRRVAELLATPPGSELPVSLLPLLIDDDASVVEVAAWAAGERHQEQREVGVDAVDDIVARLVEAAGEHDDPLVREAAVASLGSIGADDGLPAILRAVGDKVAIRRRAVIALAPFDGPEVEAALRGAVTDRDWQVRQAAEDLLAPDD